MDKIKLSVTIRRSLLPRLRLLTILESALIQHGEMEAYGKRSSRLNTRLHFELV